MDGEHEVKMNRSDKGLTLVETLVVVAILLVLAAITFNVVSQVRERAKVSSCANNLRQIAKALHLYAAVNDDYAPPVHTWRLKNMAGEAVDYDPKRWRDLLAAMIDNTDVFYCPSDRRARTTEPDPGVDSYQNSLYTSYSMPPIVNGTIGPNGSVLTSLSALRAPHVAFAEDRVFTVIHPNQGVRIDPKLGVRFVSTHGDRGNVVFYDGRVVNMRVMD